MRRIYGAGLDESLHSLSYNGAGEANAFGVLQDSQKFYIVNLSSDSWTGR
jgi:hypothetical protein